jgi:hypothetical protein
VKKESLDGKCYKTPKKRDKKIKGKIPQKKKKKKCFFNAAANVRRFRHFFCTVSLAGDHVRLHRMLDAQVEPGASR